MMNDDRFLMDKRLVRRSFDRSAERYDEAAVLQREVCDRLLERLDLIAIQPQRVLDLGAGTGYALDDLLKRYRKAEIVALDISPRMLLRARRRGSWLRRPQLVCADAEALPLADNSIDLLFSNLTLQWCSDLKRVFDEFRRILKPGGLLMFTTFGPDTLKELRQSWAMVDDNVHVNAFIDMHHVGDTLVRSRFVGPVMDVEHFILTYRDVFSLMGDLKQIGANTLSQGRRHGFSARGRLKKMEQAYDGMRQGGMLPASYEVIYGHAWVPEQDSIPDVGGEVGIPVDQILRRGR